MQASGLAWRLYRATGVRALRIAWRASAWHDRRQARRWDAAAVRLRADSWIALPDGTALRVDPEDRRAHALGAAGGTLDPFLNDWWRLLVAALQPTIVVDVGANYGEVLFSTRYPEGCEVVAVEANPRIARALSETVSAAGRDVAVHGVAASDFDGNASFSIDPQWSGTSRLNSTGEEVVTVPARRLDGLVSGRGGFLLMKVDVEGHELEVLRGAGELLAQARTAAVVMEFIHLDVAQLEQLHREFDVFLMGRKKRVLQRSHLPALADIRAGQRQGQWLRDVLVVSGDGQLMARLQEQGVVLSAPPVE